MFVRFVPSGSAAEYEQVALAFKAGGYVDAMLSRRGSDGRTRTLQPGDRVERGAVLAEGPYAEVSKNPQVMEAYMGTAHA